MDEYTRVFVAFNHDNQASLRAAQQIVSFFNKWRVPCSLARDVPEQGDVEDHLGNLVGDSKFLIILFSDGVDSTTWMEKEYRWFNRIHRYHTGFHPDRNTSLVYLTEGNPLDAHEAEGRIRARYKDGRIWRLPSEDNAAHVMFSSMLFGPNGIYRNIAPGPEIGLPPFCENGPRLRLDDILGFLQNFRGAHQRGVDSVLPDQKPAMRLVEKLLGSANPGQRVRMVGFTLRRYTDRHHASSGYVGRAFQDAVARGVRAQLLLLHLDSYAARTRLRIESPDLPVAEAPLVRDGTWVRETFGGEAYTGKVEIRQYRTPYVGMVLFEDRAFVEIYHLGHDGDPDPPDRPATTICGRVPVFVVRSNSPFYRLFDSHFDALWNASVRDEAPQRGPSVDALEHEQVA